MRVLCLHGLGTNSHVFEAQIEPIRNLLVSTEFVFADGLIECVGDSEIVKFYRGPFFSHWDQTIESVRQACDYIIELVEDEGPFDGVLGFSQGAALAATALRYRQSLDLKAPPLWNFAVFFNAVSSLDAGVNEGSATKVQLGPEDFLPAIPTVHVVGQQDPYRRQSMTLYEQSVRQYARFITHDSGHCIPKNITFAHKMQQAIEWAGMAASGGG